MKNCIACKHFRLDTGWCGTNVTPGDSPECVCLKGHWRMDVYGGMYDDQKDELLDRTSAAIKCPDYELSDLAKSKGWTL